MKLNTTRVSFILGLILVALSSAAVATEGYGDCKLYGKQDTAHITPAIPGQFTVLVNLPAVGEFNGYTPDSITSGREFCMAVNIAYRLGLDKVVLRNASFDSIVAGQNKDYDIALAIITVTDARDKVVDFSTPYAFGSYGLAARAGSDITPENIRDVKVGTQSGTTMVPWLQNELKVKQLSVFGDTGSMFTALAAGTVDVVMTELSIVLGQVAHSNGRLEVIGQYETGARTAGVYPDGSPNEEAINNIIADMKAEGTLDKLVAEYLAPAWNGTLPSDVPVWEY